MGYKSILFFLAAASVAVALPARSDIPNTYLDENIREDARLTTPQLAWKYGYPAEIHNVQTDDGYILEVHRIPGSPVSPAAPGKPVVFLMHGMLSSSGDFVLMGPNIGLAYHLADVGYDVWMGNARGNRYSRRHVWINPIFPAFWQFSWHEIGVTDVPNMIDFILNRTNQQKLHYIGHSMGTTVFFVMASMRPEYNNKIITMQAMGPATSLPNAKSVFVRNLVTFLTTVEMAVAMFGMYEFQPHSEMNAIGGEMLCRDTAPTQSMCSEVIFLLAGYNSEQLNTTMLPVIKGHSPAGAATRQMLHYGQTIKSKIFRRYDWGIMTNLMLYGQATPPVYDMSRITAPVALHYGDNDWLTVPEDVEVINQQLPNVIGKFKVPLPAFNHLDFVWAIDARTLIYNKLISVMRSFEN